MTRKTRDIALIILGVGLALSGIGLTVMALQTGTTPTADVAGNTTTNTTTPTETPDAASDNPPVGPLLTDSAYSETDGTIITKLLTETGDEWELHIYREDTLMTTIVPEPHELESGEISPTSSHENEAADLPEEKSYALVGSRVDSGGETETTSDDVYGITLVLPNVDPMESVRIEYVAADGSTTTMYEEAAH